jgi:uncharacterized protein YdhG (YjbR/CyaY superfamily)
MPADATEGFSAEERAAMREYVQERKAASRRSKTQSTEEGEREVLTKIAEMPEPDRAMAGRTWYGMPAYSKDGNVVCFFQPASKFKARYSTLGFSDKANLDEGSMWPSSFALVELSAADEAEVAALIKKAVS